jgi:glycine dehydrogenase
VAASNWSSASLLTIPYLYISAMGTDGLKKATQMAILNSNYLKNSLQDSYTIIDVNKDGFVGHEFIIDVSEFKELNITENDIAKRLIDYSFHPPTMSWPRSGVLMFEPTESESKDELDRLILAMKSIRREIQAIEDGYSYKDNNVLKNAPHSFRLVENWSYPYSIKEALYPVDNLYNRKFMNAIGRVDDVYGDKMLLSKKH